jgi:alanine dehydrogenase
VETSIGLVAETKNGERRVGLDPSAVGLLVDGSARVLVQAGAGGGAGVDDTHYEEAGALVVPEAADAWAADVVVKVEEPQPSECAHFRPGLRLFCYLHPAAEPALARALAATPQPVADAVAGALAAVPAGSAA